MQARSFNPALRIATFCAATVASLHGAGGQPQTPVECDKQIFNSWVTVGCTSDGDCFDFLFNPGTQSCETVPVPGSYTHCGTLVSSPVDQWRVYGGVCAFDGNIAVCVPTTQSNVSWNACVYVGIFQGGELCNGGGN
jgi:hypothetical protein